MGDVATVVGGGTPRTTDLTNFEGGDVPWITPADLSGFTEKRISRGSRNITRKGLAGSGAVLMPEGTLLFSSRAPIGYVAIAAQPVSTNQGFKSFVPGRGLLPDYLYYYLKFAKRFALDLASGTTFLEISGAKAALIPVPVPPTREQHRIVDEVEKQFTRLDAAVVALERVRANLKRYRASVLKAACEGRLVPTEAELARREGRSFESGEELLKRTLKKRRARWEAEQLAKMTAAGESSRGFAWRARYEPSGEPETAGLWPVPAGWTWASVGAVVWKIEAGASFKCLEVPPENGQTGVVKVSAVTWGTYDEREAKTCLESSRVDDRLLIREGDFLFSRANTIDLVGACVIARRVRSRVMLSDKILRFDVQGLRAEWLLFVLRSKWGRREIEALATGNQESMRNIGQDRIRKIRVPLPPLTEQHRIVAEVERRLSVVDELEATVEKNLARCARLRQSILKMAFEGRLVPQDPNDEPASVLLDRIREERGTEEPRRRGVRRTPRP